jgi:hypothetical protein
MYKAIAITLTRTFGHWPKTHAPLDIRQFSMPQISDLGLAFHACDPVPAGWTQYPTMMNIFSGKVTYPIDEARAA